MGKLDVLAQALTFCGIDFIDVVEADHDGQEHRCIKIPSVTDYYKTTRAESIINGTYTNNCIVDENFIVFVDDGCSSLSCEICHEDVNTYLSY